MFDIPQITMRMEIDFLDFDIDSFHKGLFDFGNRAIRKAGQAFCAVIAEEVPVWSGMALSSLAPLARAVGYGLVVSPAANAPDRRALGRSMGGQHPLEVNIIGGTANMEFGFNWASAVDHFNINEQMNVNAIMNPNTGRPYFKLKNPGPWKSIDKAQQAAEAVLDAEMAKVPKPTDYMVRRQITFDPERGGSLNIGY